MFLTLIEEPLHDKNDQSRLIDVMDFNESLSVCTLLRDVKTSKILAPKNGSLLRYSIYSRGHSQVKMSVIASDIHILFILPFLNTTIFSHEIVWVCTTADTLHTETLKSFLVVLNDTAKFHRYIR